MATSVATPFGRLIKPAIGRPEIVEVPEFNFLMVDGRGAPETSNEFQDAIGALYPLAYGARFALKKAGVETRVMPLEALWWTSSSGAGQVAKDGDDHATGTGDRPGHARRPVQRGEADHREAPRFHRS
ncbi:MAG TPA: hypothetical protein VMW11_06820 [Candidatus Dormibacteraeota bacterium]|nr:hypothetical protein [Candidatus Dormibacteraeota bacterium]